MKDLMMALMGLIALVVMLSGEYIASAIFWVASAIFYIKSEVSA